MLVYKMGKAPEGAVYIGRGSPWGNPFVMGRDGTRSEVIKRYKEYAIEKHVVDQEWLKPLIGAIGLVCYCKPLPCHGDVLIELLNDEEENSDREKFDQSF